MGIEGLIRFKKDVDFDAESYVIEVLGSQVAVFDKVRVRIEVEKDRNTQRGKVKMTLVGPVDTGSLQ